jgi:alpha-amylase
MMENLFSTGSSNSKTGRYIANPGGGVMMQAFIGTYLPVKLVEYCMQQAAWSNAGIGSIWLPPVSKAQTELFYGFMITDYFDFWKF